MIWNFFCYMWVSEWLDWTFKYISFMHIIKSDCHCGSDNLSCDPLPAIKSANVLRHLCLYFLQRWVAHQTFFKSYLIVCRRQSHQSTEKQRNLLFCVHINSNITVVSTDISIRGHGIWSRHKRGLTVMERRFKLFFTD